MFPATSPKTISGDTAATTSVRDNGEGQSSSVALTMTPTGAR
jgi:hypothetical protein